MEKRSEKRGPRARPGDAGRRPRRAAPTIKDVARRAKVSTATVSAVINATAYVSSSLKQRVLEAIVELDYAPSSVARSLRTQATRLIGVIIADVANPFFSQLVHMIGAAAQARGYSVLLAESDHDAAKEMTALQLLSQHGVDGIVLVPTGPREVYFRPPVANLRKPLVLVDRIIGDAPFDSVSIDNYAAAFAVTQHILSLGHRRIGIIAGARHLANTTERLAGFQDAVAAARLSVDPAHIIYADFREDLAYDLCRRQLMQDDRPTAFFVSNNEMLIGAMRAITDCGLTCPGDIALASIDDFPWASAFSPRLTTARQPIEELAEWSIRLLHERIGGAHIEAPRRIVLQASLMVRDSCQPPAAAT